MRLIAAWSQEEVEATVADYLEMLSAELRGERYSKAAHRRRLLPLLRGRTEGAIERKHGNISAALIELGFPYIEGYKPLENYQRLLFGVVSSRLRASPEVENLVAADVEAEAVFPTVDDILASLVEPPQTDRTSKVHEANAPPYVPPARIDYLRRESANASLGDAGEIFVLNYERARLLAARQDRLASRIEHVSRTRGDGHGFDVLSFEESGEERLVEVKTTKYGAQTPFFVTANEIHVSERESNRYHLYRVFAFRKAPKLFDVPGSFSCNCSLRATQYLARIA